MFVEITFVIFLLMTSAFFSSSESSIFSLEKSYIYKLKSSPQYTSLKSRLYILLKWLRKPSLLFTPLLLGNLIVNIFFTQTMNILLSHFFPTIAFNPIISLIIITTFLVVFGEIIPKTIGLAYTKSFSLFVIPLLNTWVLFVKPITKPVQSFTRSIFRNIKEEDKFTEEELLNYLKLINQYNILSKRNEISLSRYVAFQHDTVHSTMIPRSSVFLLPHNISMTQAKKLFLKNNISQLNIAIVYHQKEGHLIGYLHIKHLILMIYKNQKSFSKKSLPLLSIPATMELKDLMSIFIKKNQEVAVALSEDGEFVGIITLKMILEKLLGEFPSEASSYKEQTSSSPIRYINRTKYIINGQTSLLEFNSFFNSKLYSDISETINGLIIEHLDGFPQKNTKVSITNLIFTNFYIKQHRIIKCDMKILPRTINK